MKKILVLLLAAGLIFGLAGCPVDGNKTVEDPYAQYYSSTFRGNGDGTTEVVNNTQYDMLLFTGTTISTNYIVGGVRAGSRNMVNFSNENDFTVGGYKLLRAVKQTEFIDHGTQSRVDHTAMITYGEGRRFTTDIVSTTDGAYQYTVFNRSRDYGLELRKNSPEGDKVAYLTKGEVRRVIQSATTDELTLYPVWVAFNNQTKTIVTFSPTDVLSPRDILPKRQNDDPPEYYFPMDGTNLNIQFADIKLPFATIIIRNNAGMNASFRIAEAVKVAESGYTAVTSGARESYEIRSTGEGLNLNLAMAQRQIVVPVRFESTPGDSSVTIENGFVYRVELILKAGGNPAMATDYTAWLVKGDAISTADLLISE